ncbi:hypothetical protein B7R74_13760 [Yersinia pseudotuberculosis]|nr:hypothetical protein B7R74_13760 [Yersinia pseudotuberculosis]
MRIYPSYFKLHVRRLSSFTPVAYLCKLLGAPSVAAFLKLELFWVWIRKYLSVRYFYPLHGQ